MVWGRVAHPRDQFLKSLCRRGSSPLRSPAPPCSLPEGSV